MRNATLTAATLLALKLAWRKFFALLAIGRRADDMATSFQLGMLFDHYCAKVHVGAAVDRSQAMALREAIFGALSESERQAFVVAFREGGRVLGRSFLEAPNWLSDRIRLAAERWAESGGKSTDPDEAAEAGDAGEEVRWLRSGGGDRRVPHGQGRAGLPVRPRAGVRTAVARDRRRARRPRRPPEKKPQSDTEPQP